MAEERYRGNEYRTTIVCVDSYDKGVPTGRFYNPFYPSGKTFESLSRFLIGMEDMFDEMHFPQPFLVRRTFSEAVHSDEALTSDGERQVGKLGTFQIRVLFRQNADWQGSICWVEGQREESFRGVLEMILLMDSALSSTMK